MEISDTLKGEHPNQIKIDSKGRFILPKKVYGLLTNLGPMSYFLTEYDWENKEFRLRPPKNYVDEAEKSNEDNFNFRDFCSRHFCTTIGKGKRINLNLSINPNYCTLIHKEMERPEIKNKYVKLSWKQGYLVLRLS